MMRLDRLVDAVVHVRVRAHDVVLATRRPEGLSALNVLPGRIAELAASAGAAAVCRAEQGETRWTFKADR